MAAIEWQATISVDDSSRELTSWWLRGRIEGLRRRIVGFAQASPVPGSDPGGRSWTSFAARRSVGRNDGADAWSV
jgi:hypothetical protein